MAAPASINELLDITQKSGVVDESRLNGYLQQLRSQGPLPKEPSKLAGLMVRDGLLTPTKFGRRTVVLESELQRFADELAARSRTK